MKSDRTINSLEELLPFLIASSFIAECHNQGLAAEVTIDDVIKSIPSAYYSMYEDPAPEHGDLEKALEVENLFSSFNFLRAKLSASRPIHSDADTEQALIESAFYYDDKDYRPLIAEIQVRMTAAAWDALTPLFREELQGHLDQYHLSHPATIEQPEDQSDADNADIVTALESFTTQQNRLERLFTQYANKDLMQKRATRMALVGSAALLTGTLIWSELREDRVRITETPTGGPELTLEE